MFGAFLCPRYSPSLFPEATAVTSAIYITTPIYYANDLPHVGHAYTTIAADALARYHRLQGRDVFLLTGTDEHGINIERIAAQRGLNPRQHVDAIATSFQTLWGTLDIQYDRFVRTTEPAHERAALEVWRRLRASGDLFRGIYEGVYCPRCEAYYQAEDLVNGDCPVHGLPCDQVREENTFFRLSRYQGALERLIRDTEFVQPEARRRELLGFLRQGLKDFSVTRRQVRWGIPIPDAPGEVLYVWVDALANYLSGIGFPDDPGQFSRYWPAHTHLVGKEIIRFHCLYWPALLLSAGLPLPRRVFAHGWLTKDGQKISKTTGNAIDPAALATEFGSDAVRYYFLRAIPFGQDGDYTRAAFVARYNADLANDFGNLVQRATVLATRYGAGRETGSATLCEAEELIRGRAATLPARVEEAIQRYALHEAIAAVGELVREANRYVETTAPWHLAKAGAQSRLATVLWHITEAARVAAWHLLPVLPRAGAEAHRRLSGHSPQPGEGVFGYQQRAGSVSAGTPLFPRIAA